MEEYTDRPLTNYQRRKLQKARGTLTIKQYKNPLKRKTKIRRKTNKLENCRASCDQFTWEGINILVNRKRNLIKKLPAKVSKS